MTIAQAVELSQPGQAGLEYALTPLPVNVFFEITRQGGGDLDGVRRQKRCQILLAGLAENREIATVDDMDTQRANIGNESPKRRIQLRCTAGQIQGGDLPGRQITQQQRHGFPTHFLGSLRPGRHMTMRARLVAAVAQICLQRLQRTSVDGGEIGFYQQGKRVTHGVILKKGLISPLKETSHHSQPLRNRIVFGCVGSHCRENRL
ncbi:hypothetical protein BN873_330078 [Candidatus Competibacter denitrificans Run_A_D11]|uniref:Uncharacterized protein n=1 Tax=Candidatus Competibacter denitrificans Run_A_D11 TaxID=1400863 RepID=W6M470_9GAMM|nr:hypothetical protein BN873_330078 [Candidatus Competibacter denitrificans Run_A_D11]